jgi:hypothetical protein
VSQSASLSLFYSTIYSVSYSVCQPGVQPTFRAHGQILFQSYEIYFYAVFESFSHDCFSSSLLLSLAFSCRDSVMFVFICKFTLKTPMSSVIQYHLTSVSPGLSYLALVTTTAFTKKGLKFIAATKFRCLRISTTISDFSAVIKNMFILSTFCHFCLTLRYSRNA